MTGFGSGSDSSTIVQLRRSWRSERLRFESTSYPILSDLTELASAPIYDRFTGGAFTNLLHLSASPSGLRPVLIYDKYSEVNMDMMRFDRQKLPSFSVCLRDVRPCRSVSIDNCIITVSRTGETRYLYPRAGR